MSLADLVNALEKSHAPSIGKMFSISLILARLSDSPLSHYPQIARELTTVRN